jgi:hypothetical protein
MEKWQDIPGYEGIYQASSYGNIRTCEGKTTSNKRFGIRRWKSRILKGRGDNLRTGRRVSLWKDGKCKDWLVARLVAITFLGEPTEGFTVNHIDGNRLNNHIENLEWLSLADNIKHGFETGLYNHQKQIAVTDADVTYKFRSYAQLDVFLGRAKGYTSSRLKKGSFLLYSADGTEFLAKEEKARFSECT